MENVKPYLLPSYFSLGNGREFFHDNFERMTLSLDTQYFVAFIHKKKMNLNYVSILVKTDISFVF